MKRAWLWPVLVVSGAFAASCTSILGDFQPPGSTGQGGGGATSSSHSSSRASSHASTGSGGSGGAPECKKDSDCMDPPEPCILPFCDGGVCATKPVKKGDDSPKQVAGDCQQIVCDANGEFHTVIDVTDSDDLKECTTDKCDSDGTPHHTPMNGAHCDNDTMFCNMAGDCVACLFSGQCPGDGACLNFACQAPSCSDGVKNQDETDVDCGGMTCPNKCGDGKHCSGPDSDCESGLCVAGKCRPDTCGDGMLGPGETDVDCGGTACQPCANGKKCTVNTDCTSNLCQAAYCRVATCGNGVTDGTETDTDCGGTACQHCNTGQTCLVATDCVSGDCLGNVCQ